MLNFIPTWCHLVNIIHQSASFLWNESQITVKPPFKNDNLGGFTYSKPISMAATTITTDDLREFKMELLDDIKELLTNQSSTFSKRWLKSPEVRELLGISPGTLQNLRINGTLPYTKVGGVLYYDYEEILTVMEENRIHNKF